MTINKWLVFSFIKLEKYSLSKYYAEEIICFILNKKKNWIFLNIEFLLCFKILNKLNYLLSRCLNFEPLDYLFKKNNIFFLNFVISKDTLIPRISTKILIEVVLNKVKNINSSILDLGTGSGLIALSIAKFYKNNKILGLDKNFKSIMIAKKNAIIHDLSNVYFILSDWFNSIKNMHFDIIVSNPPYISYEENFLLKKNIFFEPLNALFSEKKGLRDIKYIIQESKKYLNSNGWLMIEHGFMQRKIILKYFKIHKYSNIISYKDIYGIYRITIGQIK